MYLLAVARAARLAAHPVFHQIAQSVHGSVHDGLAAASAWRVKSTQELFIAAKDIQLKLKICSTITSTVRKLSKKPWKHISDLLRKDELHNHRHPTGMVVLSLPWYSSGLFLLAPKILMVGKPLTPYWPPSDLCWSASTAPTLTIPCRIHNKQVGVWSLNF